MGLQVMTDCTVLQDTIQWVWYEKNKKQKHIQLAMAAGSCIPSIPKASMMWSSFFPSQILHLEEKFKIKKRGEVIHPAGNLPQTQEVNNSKALKVPESDQMH